MSLLREIQDAAIDSKSDLSVLLRKCKVLAARLGNPEFKQWIESELSGYKGIESLPDYRVHCVNSKGHFSGPFQSGLRNADIPLICIPEEFHKNLSHVYLREPIAALEALVKNHDNSSFHEPWDPNLVAFVGQNIYEGMNCMQAWKVIPSSAIVAALDAVRNRILSFALEIESESPDAGEAPINSQPLPQERVQQIFNTFITGNVQNVATGSTNVNQRAIGKTNDEKIFVDLIEALTKSKGDQKIISDLVKAVDEMRIAKGTKGFKEHYQKFISILADHMQVFGPVVAQFLPGLATLIS
ncbi:AbiTii domain-containing protein [Ruminiclostridium cellobioparum]|uniref:AbiTii domain-containing protein n=1 Tax=Ruminiclostridium cellobioparum TaxID=29355 RepID=UPI0028AC4B24|nr:hypothetical protein [Ruminiclostridium cellobioparum]